MAAADNASLPAALDEQAAAIIAGRCDAASARVGKVSGEDGVNDLGCGDLVQRQTASGCAGALYLRGEPHHGRPHGACRH